MMAGIATGVKKLKAKTSKRFKAAAMVITPILLYLAIFGVAVKLAFVVVLLIYLYFLIFHTVATLSMTGGALLMGLLKKIPDSITATVLVIAAIYFFVRWMKSGNGTHLPTSPPSSEQLKIESPAAGANEGERPSLN